MPWIYITGLAFALAMDAFAVSIATGMEIRKLRIGHIVRVSFWFGFFQFLMPVIGYLAGKQAINYMRDYDHYIAFLLLLGIGAHMIYDAVWRDNEDRKDNEKDPTRGITVIIRAIAVSIDALAAGVALTAVHSGSIFPAAVVIGLVTLFMSMIGMKFGAKLGDKLGHWTEVAGGIVLILIGLKILIEHCFYGA